MFNLTKTQKKKFLTTFVGTAIANFIVVKIILMRGGNPTYTNWSLVLTAILCGLIVGVISIFITNEKENKP